MPILELAKKAVRRLRRELSRGGGRGGGVGSHHQAEQFVREGDHVIYVGLWRTETMERWSRAIGRRKGIGVLPDVGQLWIIEADPKNCDILAYEVQRRELANVTIINAALWSAETEIEFSRQRVTDRNFVVDANIVGKSDLYSAENMRETLRVKAYSLDRIIKDNQIPLDKLRHVHLTIGGSEVQAVLGAEDLLKNGRLTFFIKSITSHRDSGKFLMEDLRELLDKRSLRYSIRKVSKDGMPKEIVISTK
jgi:FkbM family methyltransferase